MTTIYIGVVLAAMAAAQTPPAPAAHCDGLPPGKHANLERMTAGMSLTCCSTAPGSRSSRSIRIRLRSHVWLGDASARVDTRPP